MDYGVSLFVMAFLICCIVPFAVHGWIWVLVNSKTIFEAMGNLGRAYDTEFNKAVYSDAFTALKCAAKFAVLIVAWLIMMFIWLCTLIIALVFAWWIFTKVKKLFHKVFG